MVEAVLRLVFPFINRAWGAVYSGKPKPRTLALQLFCQKRPSFLPKGLSLSSLLPHAQRRAVRISGGEAFGADNTDAS